MDRRYSYDRVCRSQRFHRPTSGLRASKRDPPASAERIEAITRTRLTFWLVLLLGFIGTIGPLSTDLYLPTFTDISGDLGVLPTTVQLTLTGFLLGLGSGPLIVGPLSDRYGRRRVLLVALAVFVASGALMGLVSEIWILIALRLIQGMATAAGTVLSRTIVVDLAEGSAAVRALSAIAVAVGIGAIVAAPLGGLIGATWGWRGALLALAGIGAIMLALAIAFLPESLPAEKRHARGTGALSSLLIAARIPSVPMYAVILGATYAAMMAYISSSPFIAIGIMGLTPREFSWWFGASASAMIIGSLLNMWLAPRFGAVRMLMVGQALLGGSGLIFIFMSTTGALTPPLYFGTGFVLISGFGITMANTTALALSSGGAARGSASALLSTAQYLSGALIIPLVGLGGTHSAFPMSVAVLALAVLTASALVIVRRTSRAAGGDAGIASDPG